MQNNPYCFSASHSAFRISQEEKKSGNSQAQKNTRQGSESGGSPLNEPRPLQAMMTSYQQNLSQKHQHFSHETSRISFCDVKAHALSLFSKVI